MGKGIGIAMISGLVAALSVEVFDLSTAQGIAVAIPIGIAFGLLIDFE